MVQSSQQLLPLQQELAALQWGVDLAVVTGELWQAEERAGVFRCGAQQTSCQVYEKEASKNEKRWLRLSGVLGLRRGSAEGRADPRTCGQQKYGPGCFHVGGLQLFALLHLPLLQSSLREVAVA